jgi:hypothetical protein
VPAKWTPSTIETKDFQPKNLRDVRQGKRTIQVVEIFNAEILEPSNHVFNPQPRIVPAYTSDPTRGPLIVLGVDGVLSPARFPYKDSWQDWAPLPGAQVHVPYSLSQGKAVADLPGEVVLCSSWGTRAQLFIDAYGWDATWSLRRQMPSRWWWKLEAMRMFLGSRPQRPVVWVDSALEEHPEVTNWSRRAHFDTLLISTDRRLGLQAGDVDRILEFCADHTQQVEKELSSMQDADPDSDAQTDNPLIDSTTQV